MPRAMIELRAVSKTFAGVKALDGVDLEVAEGRTTVLLGPSGCGKSTVLRLMLGLAAPDVGRVLFDGEPLGAATLAGLRRRVGYVIQEGGLFPHMTSGENVTLVARRSGWPRQRIEQRLDRLVGLTALPADGLARYPIELSGGQRQRVALMRALMLDPDVLLLDEPLGSLDPMIRFDLQEELRAIFRKLAKTVVLVTHDIAEAAFFADRVVLLRDGRVVQQGSPSEMIDNPTDPFVTRYVAAQRGRRLPHD